ncbi:unnamed protein product, partial [Prorocentrum cordatum]
ACLSVRCIFLSVAVVAQGAAAAMAATQLRHAAARRAAAGAPRAFAAASAAGLQPLEEAVRLRVAPILLGLGQAGEKPARVAVAGHQSIDFAASLRGARSTGAAVIPVDPRGCRADELCRRLADAQARLVVLAGETPDSEIKALRDAARQVGAHVASVLPLRGSGLPLEGPSAPCASEAAPLLLASSAPGSHATLTAEVTPEAVDARVAAAVELWGLSSSDTVLSLGLPADSPVGVLDAVEAPLSVGASVALPGRAVEAAAGVWHFWAAIRDERDATVLFLPSDWCSLLLDAHEGLAPGLRAELAARWAAQPLRHCAAVAPAGSVPSSQLAQRWQEIFHCPLTWYFSCAEAGPLYTVQGSGGGCSVSGLQWQVAPDGELWVKGDGLFERYCQRPRSSAEAFREEDGFCRTGHFAAEDVVGVLRPRPAMSEVDIGKEAYMHLCKGPASEPWPRMAPDWRVKKVPMRVYEKWRAAWGGLLLTKKHNQAHKVYQGKYK